MVPCVKGGCWGCSGGSRCEVGGDGCCESEEEGLDAAEWGWGGHGVQGGGVTGSGEGWIAGADFWERVLCQRLFGAGLGVGVGTAFCPDGGGWAVSGMNFVIVGQGVELLVDSADQEVSIAAGKIPPTDAACEEDIAAEDLFGVVSDEAEGTGAVSGNVSAVEGDPVDGAGSVSWDDFTAGEGAVRPGHAELFEEVSVLCHGQRFVVEEDLALVFLLDFGGIPEVVDVAVGEEECFEVNPLFSQPRRGSFGCIDQDSFREEERVGFKISAGVEVHSASVAADALLLKRKGGGRAWRLPLVERHSARGPAR